MFMPGGSMSITDTEFANVFANPPTHLCETESNHLEYPQTLFRVSSRNSLEPTRSG